MMGNSGASSVEPGFLIQVPWRNKGRRGHLLGVQTEPDASWAVLTLWDGSRNSLGLEAVVEARLILYAM